MSYKADLQRVYHVYEKTPKGFVGMDESMKRKYPGNYIVEEFYDHDLGYWNARLKFEDKDEELMFILKWS